MSEYFPEYTPPSSSSNRITTLEPKKLEEQLDLYLTPQDIQAIWRCARDFSAGMEYILRPADVQNFKKTLSQNLPLEMRNIVESIWPKEIIQFTTLIILAGVLIFSGAGIVAAIAAIWARIWAEALLMRMATFTLSRPGITSVIMGSIPWLKELAPNKWIAYAISELRNIILYTIPIFLSRSLPRPQVERSR